MPAYDPFLTLSVSKDYTLISYAVFFVLIIGYCHRANVVNMEATA